MKIEIHSDRWTLIATGKFFMQHRAGSKIYVQPADSLPPPTDMCDNALVYRGRDPILDLGGVTAPGQKWYARCGNVRSAGGTARLRVFEYG